MTKPRIDVFLARAGWLLAGLIPWMAPAEAGVPSRFAWEILPARDIHPEGWLKTMWREDFADGLPGRLDVINRDVAQELFAAQSSNIVGPAGNPTWWPGEQEGYWHEAYIHAAFQVGDAEAIRRATDYVERVLRSQGPDGYLGIYAPDSRLLPPDDPRYGATGGELHSEAHLFLALIAFYEHTGREDVLAAVEKAARLTMNHYPDGAFATTAGRTLKAGGNSHSVTFNDPMMQLYRITGDERYLKFVALSYASYTAHPPRDHDFLPTLLEDPAARFEGHGAHTAESFHWVSALTVAGVSGAEECAAEAMEKLGRHLTPGGAMISDEFVAGRLGNGHDLYEYCTQAELIKSLTWIAEYQSDTEAAERAARLFFNASMGARIHPLGGLQYLSRDDRLDIPAVTDGKGPKNKGEKKHFQISSIIRPTCCPASSGRPVHYFLSGAWMKRPADDALALMNLMPCVLQTEVAGTKLTIDEQTMYPFSDTVRLGFKVAKPVKLSIAVRLPTEGTLAVAELAGLREETRAGFLWLTKEWRTGDVVEIALQLPVVLEKTQDGAAYYYRRGELVYALPFRSELSRVAENKDWRTGKPAGLYEYAVKVQDPSAWGSRIDPREKFEAVKLSGDDEHPWTAPVVGLRGHLIDAAGKPFEVTLVPEAASISRRVTFLDVSRTADEAAAMATDSAVSLGN